MKSVPSEISKFMDKKGFILLIRGAPGTGKTTLALTMMNEIGKTAYITNKKVYEDMKNSYPWITEEMKKNIYLMDENYEYRETDKFGNIFYLLPSVFRHAINLVEEGNIKNIVVDTWYTLLEEMSIQAIENKERENIYDVKSLFLKILKLSNMGINFIIVKEGEENDEIAYLTDGIITLRKEVDNRRVYRKIIIEKLRGIKIERSYYFYTLKDARFRYLYSSDFRHPERRREYKGEKIEKGKKIPSVYFDDVFKLERGDTVVYDFEEYVPREYHVSTVMALISNFLINGSKVVFLPPNDVDISELKYHIYLFSLEKYYKNLVFLYMEESMESFIRKINFGDLSMAKYIENEIKNSEGGPPLVVLGYDRLYNYLSPTQMMKVINQIRDIVRKYGGILLITGKTSEKEIKRYSSGIAEIYIKFKNIGGDILMYGVKPWTNIYHLNITAERGYPEIEKEVIL